MKRWKDGELVNSGRFKLFTRRHPGPGPKAPPLLLIHGFGISSVYFEHLVPHLQASFRLYAPDLPGFGKSTKPHHTLNITELGDALVPWMDALGLEKASILGASNGCQIAAEFAANYPQRVDKCILAGPTINPHERNTWLQIYRWRQDGKHEPPIQNMYMLQGYAQCGIPRLLKTLRFTIDHKMEKVLPRIQAPTLVLRGGIDVLVPEDWAEEATGLLVNGRLKTIPDKAHTLILNAPFQTAMAVQDFFSEEEIDEKEAPAVEEKGETDKHEKTNT